MTQVFWAVFVNLLERYVRQQRSIDTSIVKVRMELLVDWRLPFRGLNIKPLILNSNLLSFNGSEIMRLPKATD